MVTQVDTLGLKLPHGPAPFLRWAGSKRQLVSRLRRYWKPTYTRYVEPFAGSSTLYFALQPNRALLADKNSALIETYEVLRSQPEELHRRIVATKRSKKFYYMVRDQNPRSLSRIARAARFIYLNRNCFNGIYRTNLKGEFNVPYAPHGTGPTPSLEAFKACATLLKTADLRAWDFGTTLRYTYDGDFVYLDPPYAVTTRRMFREYGPKPFSENDLVRLASHLEQMDRRGVVFLLSYVDCAAARLLFRTWKISQVRVKRNVAGFAGSRRTGYEILVHNR